MDIIRANIFVAHFENNVDFNLQNRSWHNDPAFIICGIIQHRSERDQMNRGNNTTM